MVNLTSSPLTPLKPLILSPITLKFPSKAMNHKWKLCWTMWLFLLSPNTLVPTEDMSQRLKLSSSLCHVTLFPQRTCVRDWSCPHLSATLIFIPTKDMSQVEVVQSLFKAAQLFLLPQRTCNRSWSCPNLSARFLYSHKGHVSEIEVVLISFQAGFCLLVSLWIIIFSDLPFILFCRCFILIIKHGWTLVCGSLHSLLFHFNS